MKLKSLGKLAILSTLLTSNVFSHDDNHSFVGKTDGIEQTIPITLDEAGLAIYEDGITEEEFNSSIDYFLKHFNPVIKSYGANITIQRLWKNGTINAKANKFGSNWVIKAFGGLARHKLVKTDEFEAVLCHEGGHLLAGYPAHNQGSRAAIKGDEGNSDYYAIFACAELMWKDQKDKNLAFRDSAAEETKMFCDEVYPDSEDKQNLCYRKVEASYNLSSLLASIRKEPDVSRDYKMVVKKKVSRMYHSHPKAQCRFDTYRAAAACKKFDSFKHEKYPANMKELKEQTCYETYPDDAVEVMKAGLRPRCWFKP